MPEVEQAHVRALLRQGDHARTKAAKGNALEELVCYLFDLIPGVTVTVRDQKDPAQSQEIDVAVRNGRAAGGLIATDFPEMILIECKNWTAKVTSMEVAWFYTKLRLRGLPFGILVASKGITGDRQDLTNAHSIISLALRDKCSIVVITRQEIEAITHTDDLVRQLETKLCQLAVYGTCLL